MLVKTSAVPVRTETACLMILALGPVAQVRIAAERLIPQPVSLDPCRACETQEVDDDHRLFPFVLYDEC